MAAPALARGPCPLGRLAGEEHQAQLAREQKGKTRAYFIRCERCGLGLFRLQEGQRLIGHLVHSGEFEWISTEEAAEDAGFEAGENAREAIQKEQKAAEQGAGILSFLFTNEDEED